MKKVIWQCLKYADSKGYQTISFPTLGINLAYPGRKVAKTMVQCIGDFEEENPNTSLRNVNIVVNQNDDPKVKEVKCTECWV